MSKLSACLFAIAVCVASASHGQEIAPIPIPDVPLPEFEKPEKPANIFKDAQAYAQARCVKLYGGGISREKGYGTGIIVSPTGDILTAANILAVNERLRVVTADGSIYYGEVVRRSEALQVALGDLPARQRQAVVLRHIEGFANPEIAAIMETTVEAVESLTTRGRRALTQALAARKEELGYVDE